MYLKRLEIQGFKTFPSRTVLEFGPGITAIVGPNGSGKSNVADAIRWVLGEQSPRLMRLRRLEDALYVGGSRRPPSGFAEVSMWLDNTDGWLPLDFDEVAVTRRLHRSGDSDYLINRQRVRLRDINELFLKARLGQNSYAIMGQGLVDQVLSLRPEERRALIEEAAGIRRYRLRAQESAERLAAARDALEKIEFVIAELAPHLSQLERQARRAREHHQMAAELASAQRQWFLIRLHATRDALAAAREDEREARRIQYAVGAELEREERAEQSAAATLATARQEEQRAFTALRGLEDGVRQREQRLELESERLAFVVRRVAELDAELTSLQHEREEHRAASEQIARSNADAIAAARTQVQTHTDTLRLLDAEHERSRRVLTETEAHVQGEQASLRSAQERQAHAQRSLEQARREVDTGDARRQALLHRLREYAQGYHTRWRARVASERAAEEAARHQQQAQVTFDTTRSEVAAASDELAVAESALAGLCRRANLLAQLQRDIAAHDASGAVTGAGSLREFDVAGPLAGLIETPSGLETAIEAALGEALAAVFVPDEESAIAILTQLAGTDSRRMALLPMAPINRQARPGPAELEGVLGYAAALVTCPPALRPAIDALLGATVIVDDLTAAACVHRRTGLTAVTIDGTVFRRDGLILASRSGNESRLTLERELRELPAQIAAAQSTAERCKAARETAQRAHTQARNSLTEATQAQERALRLALKAGEALLNERVALAAIRGDLRHAARTVTAARNRLGPLLEEEARCSGLLPPLRDAAAAAVRALQQAREEMQQSTRKREQAAQSLAMARGALGALEREQQAEAAMRESRRAALARLDERLGARERESQARRKEITQARDELARERTEVEALRRQRTAAQQQALVASERAREVASLRLAHEARREVLRQELGAAERRVLAAEDERSRREVEHQRLVEEMEDEGIAHLAEHEYPVTAAGPAREQATLQGLHDRIRTLRHRIRTLGPVNGQAEAEYAAGRARHDRLAAGVADLRAAEVNLLGLLSDLHGRAGEHFREAFAKICGDFEVLFQRFFGGGAARLLLTDPERGIDSGVEIEARPPGKRLQSLSLLSGGERSMTAIALLFALLQFNPAPFCVLDEVDAALDEANVGRFGQALRELAHSGQFVVVTHNRLTMEAADAIYGVSMGRDGASTVLSLRLADIPQE